MGLSRPPVFYFQSQAVVRVHMGGLWDRFTPGSTRIPTVPDNCPPDG